MKFEGPTPETETRHVSLSFAAVIVGVAFALFGLAMAIGTITPNRAANPAQGEAATSEQSFESPPASLPAVTQPDPTAITEPADSESTPDAVASDTAVPAPPLAPVQTTAAPAPAAAPVTADAAAAKDTPDASFPSHHTKVAPPAAAPAPPVNTIQALLAKKP